MCTVQVYHSFHSFYHFSRVRKNPGFFKFFKKPNLLAVVQINVYIHSLIRSLPSPSLSDRRRYNDAWRSSACVCVSAEPRLHADGGEGNALYPVISLVHSFIPELDTGHF